MQSGFLTISMKKSVKEVLALKRIGQLKAVVQRCSVKQLFLEISQACNFIKKETLAQVFSWEFCENSNDIFLHRTPLVAASGKSNAKFQHHIPVNIYLLKANDETLDQGVKYIES